MKVKRDVPEFLIDWILTSGLNADEVSGGTGGGHLVPNEAGVETVR